MTKKSTVEIVMVRCVCVGGGYGKGIDGGSLFPIELLIYTGKNTASALNIS